MVTQALCRGTFEFRKVEPSVVERAWAEAVAGGQNLGLPETIVLPAQWTLRVEQLVKARRRQGWHVVEVRRRGLRWLRYYFHGALVCAARELAGVAILWPGERLRERLQEPSRCARGHDGPV